MASLLIKKRKMGIYNVVGQEYMDRHAFGRKVCERFGFKAKLRPFLSKERPLAIPRFLRMSIKKAETQIGKIRTLEEQFDELDREWLHDNEKA